MFRRTFWTVACLALLAPSSAIITLADEAPRRERVELRERDPIPTHPRRDGLDRAIEPTPYGGLLHDDTRRPNPQPGVVWNPGAPDSGGGTDRPLPLSMEQFDVIPLACSYGEGNCTARCFNPDASRVAGVATVGEEDYLGSPVPRIHAIVWDLDASGAVGATHELPNPPLERNWVDPHDFNGNGILVGRAFGGELPDAGFFTRPVAWRESGGDWNAELLPMGPTGLKGGAYGVNIFGWIVGWYRSDGDGDGSADSSNPLDPLTVAAWLPDPSAPTGWHVDSLPVPPGTVAGYPRAINDAGRAVGHVRREGADGPFEQAMAWDYDPATDSWTYSELSTLGGASARAVGVSAAGKAVGWSSTGVIETYRQQGATLSEEVHRTVSWVRDSSSGTWLAPLDLGSVAGPHSFGMAVDPMGCIVGESTVRDEARADRFTTLWVDGEDAIPLQERVPGNWVFELRHGIDWADIAGNAWVLTRAREGNNAPVQWVVLIPAAP